MREIQFQFCKFIYIYKVILTDARDDFWCNKNWFTDILYTYN